MTKNAIFGHKNGKKISFSGWFHDTNTMPDLTYTPVNTEKKILKQRSFEQALYICFSKIFQNGGV